jgi:aminoglycoside phosphotransferase family enzyme/predicted kinase
MTLPDDLRRIGLELCETHISWVLLGEREVWKVKKPVDLGFLDFTSVEKRRRFCEAEVRLNRRLAPDVYLDTVPVCRDPSGRLEIGGTGEGEIVDWAVHMKRLPDEHRADVRLSNGRFSAKHIETIARRVAEFHAACRCDDETRRFGTPERIGRNVRENFEQARPTILEYLNRTQAEEVESWQTTFLSERARLFAERVEADRVRDGHGDLRLEHVYLDDDGGIVIIDCIEFNDRFRFADVCADVVFLAMDLARLGRVDLAERFLALYARESNDFDLYSLVDFYESYRAFVRGKIAALVAGNLDTSAPVREKADADARRYYLLALASERRSIEPPALLAIGGVIASGKSTIAERLGAELAVPVIDADRTRKFLAGVETSTAVLEAPWEGIYSKECTEKVYGELTRRARRVLASGRPVILDASFRSIQHRDAAQKLAKELGVPFAFVECRPSDDVCRERLRERDRDRGVSDGRLEIFDDFLRRWEPVTELPTTVHVVVDTGVPIEKTMETLRARLPVSFAGLKQ